MGKQLSPHFNEDEFRCRHCRQLPADGMAPELITKLEVLRAMVGKPLIITSGYRCPTHNKAVGGAAKSQHVLGTAADISARGIGVDELARTAERVGFGGMGLYHRQNFVHVDVRPGRARW